MSVDQRALLAFLGTDADFRAWASGVAAQIATGLTKVTAETGQIDLTTVARPSINTFAGFEMYRFSDSLQATKPVFVKIEYGIGGVADRPALAVTIGTGTNGSGTLTGQVSVRKTLLATASKTTTVTLDSYCSATSSRLALVNNHDLSGTSGTFRIVAIIERTRTAAGVETGDGVILITASGGVLSAYQFIPFSGSIPAAGIPPILGMAAGRTVEGASVALSPCIAFFGKPLYILTVGYEHADIGENASFSGTHLGATHTFMPLGDGMIGGWAQGNSTLPSIAIPWE